jgi:hypothetical protein
MTTQVRVREVFKRIDHSNPISGHCWTEHGDTIAFEVVGKSGVVSKHKTFKAAEKVRQEWQDFYNKFNI